MSIEFNRNKTRHLDSSFSKFLHKKKRWKILEKIKFTFYTRWEHVVEWTKKNREPTITAENKPEMGSVCVLFSKAWDLQASLLPPGVWNFNHSRIIIKESCVFYYPEWEFDDNSFDSKWSKHFGSSIIVNGETMII